MQKTYSPQEIERKWYQHWLNQRFFASKPHPDKQPFTVVIPPPNVTGVLHMGHMLNNTIQDVLVRKARMEGKEACWVPGTDHASIATEAKVVKMLKDEHGIDKKDLTREQFLEYAWAWKEKYGGIILRQLEKLGASCDWDRTRFTMEDELSAAVIRVFVDLYRKGHIYRGVRMVNWDPQGRTAVSDEEVIYKEVRSKLYYVRYRIADSADEWITIATTRPETILADTAICVNPEDSRYTHLVGRQAVVPVIGRQIPIIADGYVDKEFGTGCLKVTPAHDLNDYELGLRHHLPVIDLMNEDGTLNAHGGPYQGMDRFGVRKKIAKDLEEAGHLVKIEEVTNKVGYSERTDAVIEPKLSLQWFVKMKDLSKPALDNVMNDTIKFHPAKFKNTYRHWMENVKDWCISRQLWWGQRIPAYYLPDGRYVVAETAEEALQLARQIKPDVTLEQLRQDEDVLDTWFSSWLWPISVFDGLTKPGNEDIRYYYPTNDLVTAPEILFFWVARMIIAGYEYMGEKPFENVYLTGIVRDKLGRKMSKSLGNSPDPLDLIDKYGADGVRTGMLFSSPAGNDLLFDEKLCEQGRNFCNKIWNALRLIKGWEVSTELPAANQTAIAWFEARQQEALAEIHDHFQKYRLSDALQALYKLIWDDFCGWYLEMIKPEYGKPIDARTYQETIRLMGELMKMLHPFMPFITEEVWHELAERSERDCICVADYPVAKTADRSLLEEAARALDIITNLRNLRNTKQLSPKQAFELHVKTTDRTLYVQFGGIISRLANVSEIIYTDQAPAGAATLISKADELFVPLAGAVNADQERENLHKELEYTKGFLDSVLKKLSNEKFVQNAKPEVLANEQRKKADAEAKIKALEAQLALI